MMHYTFYFGFVGFPGIGLLGQRLARDCLFRRCIPVKSLAPAMEATTGGAYPAH